jgi:hypothetical protein
MTTGKVLYIYTAPIDMPRSKGFIPRERRHQTAK